MILRERVEQVVYPVLVAACTLFILFPVLYMVLTALKPSDEVISIPPRLFPSRVTLDNFATFLRGGNYAIYVWNSFYVAAWTAVLTAAIASMAAYSLSRIEYPGKTLVGYLILLTYMFPPILLAIPLFLVFARLRLANTYTGLILAHTSFALPFGLWLLRDFFQTIPRQLEHAARIDGASALRAVWSVTLPLSLPGIGAAMMFAFVLSWSDFLFAFVFISRDELRTLPLLISKLVGTYTTDWGMVMAAATFAAIPPLIAVLCLHRYLLRGFGVAGDRI